MKFTRFVLFSSIALIFLAFVVAIPSFGATPASSNCNNPLNVQGGTLLGNGGCTSTTSYSQTSCNGNAGYVAYGNSGGGCTSTSSKSGSSCSQGYAPYGLSEEKTTTTTITSTINCATTKTIHPTTVVTSTTTAHSTSTTTTTTVSTVTGVCSTDPGPNSPDVVGGIQNGVNGIPTPTSTAKTVTKTVTTYTTDSSHITDTVPITSTNDNYHHVGNSSLHDCD